ncbi:hypothetical protein VPH35_065970 [Triticum aestivum]
MPTLALPAAIFPAKVLHPRPTTTGASPRPPRLPGVGSGPAAPQAMGSSSKHQTSHTADPPPPPPPPDLVSLIAPLTSPLSSDPRSDLPPNQVSPRPVPCLPPPQSTARTGRFSHCLRLGVAGIQGWCQMQLGWPSIAVRMGA